MLVYKNGHTFRKKFNVGDAPLRVPQNGGVGGTCPCASRKMAGWAGRTGVRPLRKIYCFASVLMQLFQIFLYFYCFAKQPNNITNMVKIVDS